MQNDKKRARGYLVRLLQFAIIFGGLLGLGLFVGSNSLPQLFSDETQVIALARRVIPAVAIALVSAKARTCTFLALVNERKNTVLHFCYSASMNTF